MSTGFTAPTGRPAWSPLTLPTPSESFVRASGDPLNSHDPATGELVATVRVSTPEDVTGAVDLARASWSRGGWRSDGAQRARALYGFAQALRENQERLAELLTREQGKTIHESRLEIAGSADMTEYYAGLARAVYGRSMVLKDDVQSVVLREPMGVVAVITPKIGAWNGYSSHQ